MLKKPVIVGRTDDGFFILSGNFLFWVFVVCTWRWSRGNCVIVSFDENVLGVEEESIQDGEKEELNRSFYITEVTTEAGTVYNIDVDVNLIYREDEDRKGITQIVMEKESEESEVIIGYEWPDYYDEGSQMAYDIVTALNEDDAESLKGVLAWETRMEENVDGQIARAMDFVEGRALMGRVEGDGLEYNGKHDYDTKVREEEEVENYEPVKTTLTVHCTNIETDAGRVYEMKFTYLLREPGASEPPGVTELVLYDEKGNGCRIGA